MVELEIDGRKVQVPEGSMVMHAADKLDIYVPHFCYHKKLTIAANCRMCLVDVEKAPKPLPACATPVTAGMKVFTASDKAIRAQKGVMEFLLINHPLDCPICDQGGECQLQDLAVGYGSSSSRYGEEKRVVFHKNLGPLVSAEEMTRCIHCTRCVRFGQEVAGVMELGMAGRGEHSEIMSFVGRSIDSELSGNMIDVCPVGALTSKPFRYSARTWELTRRRSIAPHDSLGSNVIVQLKNNRVMRVVPYEEEEINECWISDKDRFSYEALNSDERLRTPMIKQDGQWREVDWQTALQYASHALRTIAGEKRSPATGAGAQASPLGALISPHATVEEAFLAGQLMRGLGSENIDSRLRQADFSAGVATPWLGRSVASLELLDSAMVIGSFLRKDHPLIASRLRRGVKSGMQLVTMHAVDEDLLVPATQHVSIPPSQWVDVLSRVVVALHRGAQQEVPGDLHGVEPDDVANALADALRPSEQAAGATPELDASGKPQPSPRAVLLGNSVVQHPHYARLASLARRIAELTGATFGHLVEAANTVGTQLAGAVPGSGGLNARTMVEQPRRGYLLLNVDPSLDTAFARATLDALKQAESVVALTMFRSAELLEVADCLLPVAPFTETSGTFVNCEGRAQSFNGVAQPAGHARPAWKVFRVLGNLLELSGFDYDTSEAVRSRVLSDDIGVRLASSGPFSAEPPAGAAGASAFVAEDGCLERIADVPIYAADPLVRRAESLQLTRDARVPKARLNSASLLRLAIAAGDKIRVTPVEGSGEALLEVELDERVAANTIRIAAAVPSTAGLPSMTGSVRVAKA